MARIYTPVQCERQAAPKGPQEGKARVESLLALVGDTATTTPDMSRRDTMRAERTTFTAGDWKRVLPRLPASSTVHAHRGRT